MSNNNEESYEPSAEEMLAAFDAYERFSRSTVTVRNVQRALELPEGTILDSAKGDRFKLGERPSHWSDDDYREYIESLLPASYKPTQLDMVKAMLVAAHNASKS